jgi:hypothetical protein
VYLIINALIKQNAQRPPVYGRRITLAPIDLRSKVGKSPRLAGQQSLGGVIGRNILFGSVWLEGPGLEDSQNQPSGCGPRNPAGRCRA